MKYLPLIQAIKQAPDGFYFESIQSNTYQIVSRLHKIGCIKIDVERCGGLKHRLVARVAPKTTPPAIVDCVQVSFWRTGKREGKFSSLAYPVIRRTGDWITYEDATGNLHTVKSERTRKVA